MNTIQPLDNDSDCVPLYLPQSLFLKPYARIHVSVTLPASVTGKPISNFDIMERLRSMVQPEKFSVLKVTKSTIEFIRFEGELENAKEATNIINRLDGRNIKLANFTELLKVRSSLAKDTFPSRHAWDSYFRDARDMDEMKPGERPDTVHLSNLPIRWFCPRHQEMDENVRPSESIFKRIFEKFGQVRAVDIPICDPYRKEMKSQMSGMHTFSHDQEQYFDAFVQFDEYLGFTETMRALRNMKLVRKEKKSFCINISVDFDRTKHLSDSNVKRRNIVRERCIAKEKLREDAEKKKRDEELEKKEQERKQEEAKRQLVLDQQRERENRRKEKQLAKLRTKEQLDISSKIRAEEKKLMLAQRKLESIRVLESLFERIKIKAPHKTAIKKESKDNGTEKPGRRDPGSQLVNKFKMSKEEEFERQKSRLQLVKSSGLLVAALKGGNRSPSVTSISSDDSVLSDSKHKKKKKKKNLKKKKKRKDDDSSESESSSGLSIEEETRMPLLGHHPPGPYPMYNPETGQWMGMYPPPYANPFMAGPIAARPEYFAPSMGYRGGMGTNVYRGGPRGRYIRGNTRGGGRGGRGGYQSYDVDGGHGYHRDRHSRSRSNSRGRRSHSRTRGVRPHSRSRRSRSKSKQKLVSTLRKSHSSTRWSSRSRSRSRSRSKSRRSWSRRSSRSSRSRSRRRRHRSRSRDSSARSRTRSRYRSKSRQARSRSRSKSAHPNDTKRSRSSASPSKRNRSRSDRRATEGSAEKANNPKENGHRSVERGRNRSSHRDNDRSHGSRDRKRSASRERKRSASRHDDGKRTSSRDRRRSSSRNGHRASSRARKDSPIRNRKRSHSPEAKKSSSRAASVDSATFVSPKRRQKSATPETAFDQ